MQPFHIGVWQSVRNVGRSTIQPFSPVQVTGVDVDKDTKRTVLKVQTAYDDASQNSQYPLPPLVGFSSARTIQRNRGGEANFSDLAVATVNDLDVKVGALVFACSQRGALEPLSAAADDDGRDVLTVKHHIVSSYRVVALLDGELAQSGKGRAVLVHRLHGWRALCQADEDIEAESAGVFRVHSLPVTSGVNPVDQAGEEPPLSGATAKSRLYLKAFSRWASLSKDDWALIEPVDGVLSTIGGGGGDCNGNWNFRANGTITGGTWAFDLVLNEVSHAVVIPYGPTNAEILQKIEEHPEYGGADVPTVLSIRGGPLLSRDVIVEWSRKMDAPAVNNASLTGGGMVRSGQFHA